jgi:hypothetical protein
MMAENIPDFVQKQKSFLQSADFLAVSAQRTTDVFSRRILQLLITCITHITPYSARVYSCVYETLCCFRRSVYNCLYYAGCVQLRTARPTHMVRSRMGIHHHCAHHFWLFPPSGPLWIMKMDHCVLERRKKHFSL